MAESLFRCALYVRVSTEEQAENPEGSIKNQEQRLREFIKLKNHVSPFGEVAGVFSDPGFSAKDMNRPGFQKLLQAIERREIDLILVTELSRLTRSMKDFGLLQEFLRKQDCQFLSLRENFDTSSATGGMVLNIMASIAEFERRQTGERIAQSFLARAKRGLHNGGAFPLGYGPDSERRGSLQIIPEEAELVKLVFATFLKQETLAATAQWLNQNRVEQPTRMKGSGKDRGKTFRIDTVHKLVRNPAYAAIREYRTKKGPSASIEQTPASWEPIVDRETFERVQGLLAKNRYRKRTHLNLRYPFTLSGFCYCQQCGDRMSGKSAHGNGGKIPYYEHTWVTKHLEAGVRKRTKCEPYRVLAQKVEPEVWRDAKLFLTSPVFAQEILQAARSARPEAKGTGLKKRLEVSGQTLARQIEVLARRIAKLPESLDPTAIYSEMERLQAEKRDVEEITAAAAVADAPTDDPISLESLEAFTASFRARLGEADSNPELRAAILRRIVHRVEITKTGYEVFFHAAQGYYAREFGGAAGLAAGGLSTAKGLSWAKPVTKPLPHFFKVGGSKRFAVLLGRGWVNRRQA